MTLRTSILTWMLTVALLPCAQARENAVARGQAKPPTSSTLAWVPMADGEVRAEQFADGTLIVFERSHGAMTRTEAVQRAAKSRGLTLCPAQLFELVAAMPAPPALAQFCTKPAVLSAEVAVALRAEAKAFRIFSDIDARPGFCNGVGGDATQFREIECQGAQTDLLNDTFYDSANALWCSNTLRTSMDRSMSGMLGEEGEVATVRAASCGGNTRFRFYKRDDTGDSWNLYRDFTLLADEYLWFYSYDNDSFGDSDFRFRLDSTGSGHRSTGYFIDD